MYTTPIHLLSLAVAVGFCTRVQIREIVHVCVVMLHDDYHLALPSKTTVPSHTPSHGAAISHSHGAGVPLHPPFIRGSHPSILPTHMGQLSLLHTPLLLTWGSQLSTPQDADIPPHHTTLTQEAAIPPNHSTHPSLPQLSHRRHPSLPATTLTCGSSPFTLTLSYKVLTLLPIHSHHSLIFTLPCSSTDCLLLSLRVCEINMTCMVILHTEMDLATNKTVTNHHKSAKLV